MNITGTFTEVELDPSVDKALLKALNKPSDEYTADDIAEIRLGYVGYTRHTHFLIGSQVFDKLRELIKEIK